jgi:3-oxoacyl-[acyl-carrier-protein] synthase II
LTGERVVVTGLGLMTGLGLDLESSWAGLIKGERPAARFTLFDPDGLRAGFGVELPAGADDLFKSIIKPRRRKQMTRGTMIAVATAKMAVADAGLDIGALDSTRVGVVLGATGTGYAPTTSEMDQYRILKNMACASASWVSLIEKTKGPSFVVSTACSSGTFALHAAYMLIQTGQCDAVITGSADSALSYPDVEGFQSLMAVSEEADDIPRASRPFDKTRSGFVMGEGGGVLVVEREGFAIKRGASPLAVLHLPGLTSEAYNIISPEPSGKSIADCMRLALSNAGIPPESIDYLNAHGTSTPLNDMVETQAIKEVFGNHAYRLSVSATKSMTGHCLSAASGVEAIITIKAMNDGIVPPTMNLEEIETEMDLDFTPNAPKRRSIGHALSNSFAFGGHNGVLVFSKV